MAKILLVDDDEDIVAAVTKVLQREGHEVRASLQMAGTIELMEKDRPDLVILDVMFPEDQTGGFNVARQIRQKESFKTLPILMLTAINEKSPVGLKLKSQNIDEEWLPVSEFLEKPVDLDVLKNKIAKLLKK